ncbi:MAG: hypothetical protein H0U57_06880 [Tatlockia sp.]|nr:hypothetical protein [Tatlockia sp.]
MQNDKIGNPTKYYKHPDEVKNDRALTTKDKIILLENWLDDINLKLVAEDENMPCTVEAPKNYTNEIKEILANYKPVFS